MILPRRVITVFLFAWLTGAALYAHDPGLSAVEVRVRSDALELTASYALADIQKMLPPSVRLGTDTSRATIEAAQTELEQLASLLWEIQIDSQQIASRDVIIDFTPSDNLAFRYFFPRTATGLAVIKSANLSSLPSTHRELLTLVDAKGRLRAAHTLTASENISSFSLMETDAEPPVGLEAGRLTEVVSVGPSVFDFLMLGILHIATGYDHLLFLFGLLLVCRGFRSVVIIITCFTLAHSMTLGLATLNLINVPSWLIEPLIALSIVFVGMENLYLFGAEARHRGWLTFSFGLIHGFGFANVLRDLGVGSHGGGIAMPLLSFNLGVEIGQICFAALVLPVLAYAFRSVKVRHRGVPVASAVVASVGLYWLISRTLLSR